ncbi:MAG: hypothetical protein JWM57_1807, partial [Phycisphaerales bacterium]|nr:hypothetical protein [Phycisphaerales bacterium]
INFLRSHTVVHDERADDVRLHFRVTVGRQLLIQLRANPSIEVEDDRPVDAAAVV